MLHDTGLSLVPAGSLVVGAMDAAKTEGWFRKHIRRAIGLGALVEVLVQFTSYDLLPEVILLVVLSFAGMTAALAGSSYDTTGGAAPRWANRVVILGGLILLGGPVLHVVQNAGTMDWGLFGRELFQPVWLTVLTLPLAFYMSLVSTYEDAMVRLRWWADGKPTWRQRLALVVGFNLHPRALTQFVYRTNAMFELVKTTTFRRAIAVVRGPTPPTPDAEEDEEEDEPTVPAKAPEVTPRRRKHQRPHGRRRSR